MENQPNQPNSNAEQRAILQNEILARMPEADQQQVDLLTAQLGHSATEVTAQAASVEEVDLAAQAIAELTRPVGDTGDAASPAVIAAQKQAELDNAMNAQALADHAAREGWSDDRIAAVKQANGIE